ncbi:sugar phosphate isomerase/epimerase family protein [Paenibacillus roseipurpureus]|uniref:Sugar phosphate isomerase/epimerase n=1 Tax=Paenibacillus roseopurpureus TaxID=2918901 RepID=A0AA96LKX3_9BACL|nr:sugar phosphate isomerase/epimerase [Paenibacillus sp. MBLB1832]WNR42854.1 sugar phosphate isomerase/epimerase [Paenibacillus sp. MBLB1832]
MKLAISGQVFAGTLNLEHTLKTISKYGIDTIEIWPGNITPLEEDVCPDAYEGRDIPAAKKLLDEYGFKVSAVSMSAAFHKVISADLDKYAAALLYAVEVAKTLGAQYVNHYCYNLSLEISPDLERIKKAVTPATRFAEKEGIILCLENEAHDATQTPEGMLHILQAMDSPNFKTTFDATNYYQAGQESFPYAYDLLKPYIAYVHLKNGCVYRPELGHSEKSKGAVMTGSLAPNYIYYPPLPEGTVNMDGVLARLEKDGYTGFCIIEPHTKPELAEHYLQVETAYVRERGYF